MVFLSYHLIPWFLSFYNTVKGKKIFLKIISKILLSISHMFDQLFILAIILPPKLHHASLCILDLCADPSPSVQAWISRSLGFVSAGFKTSRPPAFPSGPGLALTTETLFPVLFHSLCQGNPVSLYCEPQRRGKLPFPLSAHSSFPPVPQAAGPRPQTPPAQPKKAPEGLSCLPVGSGLW